MSNSTRAPSSTKVKPAKPRKDFPLFAHASGQWAKKIKGKVRYFGPWSDPQGAEDRYLVFARTRKKTTATETKLSVGDLCNHFLSFKLKRVESGELRQRSWEEYRKSCQRIIKHLGRSTDVASLGPGDFDQLRSDLAKGWGLKTLESEIGRIRTIFNYGPKSMLLRQPVAYGMSFSKPSRKALRQEANAKQDKIFELDELIVLYKAANPQMRCFMLMGLNGGMGNTDLGLMEPRHIKEGWVMYPRPKTAVNREFPLWDESLRAIAEAKRPRPGLPYLFSTKRGQSWAKDDRDNPLSKEFRKLCLEVGCHQKGRGFYALRHQFRTIADATQDQPAIDRIMGHADESMAANYREWIAPTRLQAVVDHVHAWAKPIWEAA